MKNFLSLVQRNILFHSLSWTFKLHVCTFNLSNLEINTKCLLIVAAEMSGLCYYIRPRYLHKLPGFEKTRPRPVVYDPPSKNFHVEHSVHNRRQTSKDGNLVLRPAFGRTLLCIVGSRSSRRRPQGSGPVPIPIPRPPPRTPRHSAEPDGALLIRLVTPEYANRAKGRISGDAGPN